MFQELLFAPQSSKIIEFQHMRLNMDECTDGYVGLLEVNSNKFYVNFSLTEEGIIAQFEIFSAKGYFEFNLKIIKMIRNIVQNLYSLA